LLYLPPPWDFNYDGQALRHALATPSPSPSPTLLTGVVRSGGGVRVRGGGISLGAAVGLRSGQDPLLCGAKRRRADMGD
jgi:hypothetical protein